jgi:pseudouridine kinase
MARVVVIGGANVDIKGRASRSFIGGTSNPGDVRVSAGGVGRNIAENLARLGVETALLTVLGRDANGRMLREATAAAGVDLSLTIDGPAATGAYLVILDHRGEVQSALNDMRGIEALKPADLEAASARLSAADLLVADCNISAACLSWLCGFAGRAGKRLLIEPVSVPKSMKLLEFARRPPVFAITPNRQQLQALTGETALDRAVAGLHTLGFASIVVHLGAAGAAVSAGAGITAIDAVPAADVADVTGAGDAAVAGLVLGLLEGLPLEAAARLGQASAAVKLASPETVAHAMSRDRVMALAGFA